MIRKLLCLILLSLPLAACDLAYFMNAGIPREGYTVREDMAYGELPRQKLDIYIPQNIHKDAPVVVFFHGGSWQMGSKDNYIFLGQALASKGFITVIPNYRLYPEVYFPDFVTDAAHAFSWVHRHIGEYGGNPDRLYLVGHSAGGHIAAMLTFDERFLRKAEAKKSWIKGLIGIAGPYDFLPLTDPKLQELFGKQDLALTQPVNFVRGRQPPVLLATGDGDDIVLPRNSYRLADKLKAQGSEVKMAVYPGIGHIGIMLSLADGFRAKAPLLDDIAQFIETH